MRPTQIALFLAPFVAYALFLWVTKAAVLDPASWPPRVLVTLGIVAMLLTIGGFLYLAHFSGAPPGSIYIPAYVDEHGRLVPGRTQ
jgi:hypothetical protein